MNVRMQNNRNGLLYLLCYCLKKINCNNKGNLAKTVYKHHKDGYTYKEQKKFLRRSNEMIVIVKLMSLVVTTSAKVKFTHSTRSEWIA